MGHIELAAPVAHAWYTQGNPSILDLLLGVSHRNLEGVLNFKQYVVIDIDEAARQTALIHLEERSLGIDQISDDRNNNSLIREELLSLRPLLFLSESRYRELKQRWAKVFRAEIGAQAILEILRNLNLDELAEALRSEVFNTTSKLKRRNSVKRLALVKAFRQSGNRPEWMVLTVLPVLPPDLRPMVQLDGGRFATSDLNDLYRRVINRNNRLKRLLELGADDVIVRNEKRMLQEAVDSLIDNSQRGKALSRRGRRELKSLSDMFKGKNGLFRRNLLGKRVDYSGRSVIVVGPKLKLSQCGIPKVMALELYRPFIISRLVACNYAANVKSAKRFIEFNRPEVWDILEEVIRERPILLTSRLAQHRLGLQAFEPVLVEGSSIQLHPLAANSFNVNFDGEQIAVYLPLSDVAVREAYQLMLSSVNLLNPANGESSIGPTKDIVLGVYYLTKSDQYPHRGAGRAFADADEVELAYNSGQVDIHAPIRLIATTWYDDQQNRLPFSEKRLIETTVGRSIFNRCLPMEFQFVNWVFDERKLVTLMTELHQVCDVNTIANIADEIKDIGFKFASRSGYSLAMSDFRVPIEKREIIERAQFETETLQINSEENLITDQELKERFIGIWQSTTDILTDAVKSRLDPDGNLASQFISGATSSGFEIIPQLTGMSGLVTDSSGHIVLLPVSSSYFEGLTAPEYFISTYRARKGRLDKKKLNADVRNLSRRLMKLAQDTIVHDDDCGTIDGIIISISVNRLGRSFDNILNGRMVAEQVTDPRTGEVLAKRDDLLNHERVKRIVNSNAQEVKVRSPLTCGLIHGVCARCYGMDLGRGTLVEIGTAVGIIAAQSIAESSTHLTISVSSTKESVNIGKMETGIQRVNELFEARKTPTGEAVISEINGVVQLPDSGQPSVMKIARIAQSEIIRDRYDIPEGWTIVVENGSLIDFGDELAKIDKQYAIKAQNAGRVRIENGQVFVSYKPHQYVEYDIPSDIQLLVHDGDHVDLGQPLTEGSLNPHLILNIQGRQACQKYLISEIQQVYLSHGLSISDKHIEVIVREMMTKVQITHPGDTNYLPDQVVDYLEIRQFNEQLLSDGQRPAKFKEMLLGITKAAQYSDSFLSAFIYQYNIKVLAEAAIASSVDNLSGLKESVVIGKLIHAGTGFVRAHFAPLESQSPTISKMGHEPVALSVKRKPNTEPIDI